MVEQRRALACVGIDHVPARAFARFVRIPELLARFEPVRIDRGRKEHVLEFARGEAFGQRVTVARTRILLAAVGQYADGKRQKEQ